MVAYPSAGISRIERYNVNKIDGRTDRQQRSCAEDDVDACGALTTEILVVGKMSTYSSVRNVNEIIEC